MDMAVSAATANNIAVACLEKQLDAALSDLHLLDSSGASTSAQASDFEFSDDFECGENIAMGIVTHTQSSPFRCVAVTVAVTDWSTDQSATKWNNDAGMTIPNLVLLAVHVIIADFLGNLGRVDTVGACEFDIFIRPDTCNVLQRVWFYFAVRKRTNLNRVSDCSAITTGNCWSFRFWHCTLSTCPKCAHCLNLVLLCQWWKRHLSHGNIDKFLTGYRFLVLLQLLPDRKTSVELIYVW